MSDKVKRNKEVKTYLTEQELAAIRATCDEWGCNLATLLRMAALGLAKECGKWPCKKAATSICG